MPSPASASSSSPQDSKDLQPKVSQRPSQSCTFCTRRKIKCDRHIPCSACIRRGHPESCQRQPAIVRGRLVNGSPAPQEPLTAEQLHLLREGQLQRDNLALRKRVAELEAHMRDAPLGGSLGPDVSRHESAGLLSAPESRATSAPAQALPGDGLPQHDPLRHVIHVMGVPQKMGAAAALGGLAGPGFGGPDGMRASGDATPIMPDLPAEERRNLSAVDLFGVIPYTASKLIVRASFKFVGFLHCAMHAPSWIDDHDRWIDEVAAGRGRDRSDAFLSSYFAIISSGLYFADDMLCPVIAISKDVANSVSAYFFDCCLEALHRSKFMSTNPTIEALQAIVILPTIAYNFGASAYSESLMHMGLRIAQLLELHLLRPEPPAIPPGLVEREIGRRVWLVLRMAESRLDFKRPGMLKLPKGICAEPHNTNDDDLSTDHPFTAPKYTSHCIAVTRLFTIVREYATSMAAAHSLKEQYEIATKADQAMDRSMALFPHLNHRSAVYPETLSLDAPFDSIPNSQYMLSVLRPATRILIFRTFLGMAYSDARFAEARQICLSAARDILEARMQKVPPLFLRPWPVAAYTITAGLIYGTELMHGAPSPAERVHLVAGLGVLHDKLDDCGSASFVVQRGKPMLASFLKRAREADEASPATAAAAAAALPDLDELWPVIALEQGSFAAELWGQAVEANESYADANGWWSGMPY